MADESFKDRVTMLLKGLLMPGPGSLETRDGNPLGNPARISSSVKEKSRVLEGEMGRLSQEVNDLKKIKDDLLAVKNRLDYEMMHLGRAEVEVGNILKMVQGSRDSIMENLYRIECEQERPVASPSASVPMEVCSDEDTPDRLDEDEQVLPNEDDVFHDEDEPNLPEPVIPAADDPDN